MARNGSGVYSKPAGTTFVANTTILSAKVNEVIDDLVADNNVARPVVAGGTGATTAASARTNLGIDYKNVFTSKSANYTAVGTDNNATLRFSGAYTLSLTAAATLAANWHITVMADGGDVTVDPDGAETIDGAATLTIPDGFGAMIFCTGSAFYSQTIQPYNATLDLFSSAGPAALSNYISGFTLSNNGTDATNDIDIAAGACTDSTNAAFINLSSAITKRLDAAWAVGSGEGGLDTGSIADGTYHLYAIKRVDTDVVDVIFSASASAPTLPANYTLYRYLWPVVRKGGTILAFTQIGDDFLLSTAALDVDVTNQSTTAVSRTLSVPTGVKVEAKIRSFASCAALWRVLITSLDQADVVPDAAGAPLYDLGSAAGNGANINMNVMTNTSGQVRTRSTAASTTLRIATYGWRIVR